MKKNLLKMLMLAISVLFFAACGPKYSYESVPNDPINARIYTLDNGLKIYMTVNKDEPRIQANIAVRVGAKNDPAETTGLAHYFEHLMFKGTKSFGTQNYEAEKVILDKIEAAFESYRKLTNEAEREAAYHVIDSLSYEASKYAIPNEYDKLMSAIGAKGTNAYTGYDMTVYVEDIPSNQIETWAKIEADRFKNNVIRGFHTELETVYEEKNMSLTQDDEKVIESLFASLLPHHPYGTQTVLGTQENLKNPSITNIKNYYNNWYVPNNMAICLSGDFNPDEMIVLIDKYFGNMVPNNNIKRLEIKQEEPINEPIIKTVYGKESPNVTLGWRFPGVASEITPVLTLFSNILCNGNAGLIDLNVNQTQKVLGAYAGSYEQADYTAFIMQGMPKQGQSLDEVKAILLEQLGNIKKGNFDEKLIKSTINNYKKQNLLLLESNNARATKLGDSFINGTNWADEVSFIDRMAKITKDDIIKFANDNFNQNYVVVNKLEGIDTNEVKIAKPKITPILTNRDTSSVFLKDIQTLAAQATPIQPVFLDYTKDLEKLTVKDNIELLYKQNVSNDLFELTFVVDMGTNDNKLISTAVDYFEYLGTSTKTAEEIMQELYNIACDVSLQTSAKRTYLKLSGLSENMEVALKIMEDKLADAQPNEQILKNLKSDINISRTNAKLNQSDGFSKLNQYVIYGANNPSTNILSGNEIEKLTSNNLLTETKGLFSRQHYIMYYGPMTKDSVVTTINTLHNVPAQLTPVVKNETIVMQPTKENIVYIAPYDAKQIYMISYSNNGAKFATETTPIITMYNDYFGGGMNSIVFQEMREARGLAYSANARYVKPLNLNDSYCFTTFIATQNDKMMDAITAFDNIVNNMPVSEGAFKIAKGNILANISTERILKSDILWNYVNARELGLSVDARKDIYEKVKNFTLQDVEKFQQENVKGRVYTIGILGNAKDLDLKTLGSGKYGKIVNLTQKDIFGY
ncbi:MAG: insulinase family protein [Bacteroidales bacterium]